MMDSTAEIHRDIDGSSKPWYPGDPVQREAVYFDTLPSYNEFFQTIFLKNQLCILGPNCTSDWPSRRLWVNLDGTPNFEFLSKHFGKSIAPVTKCNVDGEGSSNKTKMLVSEFIEYWKKYRGEGYPSSQECFYLKDWHFTRQFPNFSAYHPPPLLCSDWLNEFWDVRQDETENDDYRFVYLGPKNSWTPFHSDVLRSYSWSANICGRKKWIFFPPGDEEKLKDRHGQLVYDLRDPTLEESGKYPNAKEVLNRGIEVIQEPGEIVFVPSGWHHQVFNLEDTISINHNWINGAGVHLTWGFLSSQMEQVKKEIADCSTMPGFDLQCQKILKADSGMDYVEFYNFVATIARHRICALEVYLQHYSKQQEQMDSIKPVNLCLLSAANIVWKSKNYQKQDQQSDMMSDIIFSTANTKTKNTTSRLALSSSMSFPSPFSSESSSSPPSPQSQNEIGQQKSESSHSLLSTTPSQSSRRSNKSLSKPTVVTIDDDKTSSPPIPSLKELVLSSMSSTTKIRVESRSSSYTSSQHNLPTLRALALKSMSLGESSAGSSVESFLPKSSISSVHINHRLSSISSLTPPLSGQNISAEYEENSSPPILTQPRLIKSMPETQASLLMTSHTSTKSPQPVTFEPSISSPPAASFLRKSVSGIGIPDVPPPSLSSVTQLASPFPTKSSSLCVFTSLSSPSLVDRLIESTTSLTNMPQTSTSTTELLTKSASAILKPPSQQASLQQVSTSTQETKTLLFQHSHCPHWAHCGPNLAFWDLQRIERLLQTLRQIPDWVAVLSHEENQQKLLENEQSLVDSLQHCLQQYDSI